ncbi:MAG: hypothetical protein ACXQTI_05275 [Candidatus Nezhaarchaeales archaeon]
MMGLLEKVVQDVIALIALFVFWIILALVWLLFVYEPRKNVA